MTRFLWTFYTYIACFNFFAWLPIFFLYFDERVTTQQVLLLEAIYYAAVVLAEIPCGMLSDRVGRWQTLAATMVGLILAYSLFWVSSTFWWLAAAQIILGVSFALNSGTDTSLLYETLEDMGEAAEYPAAEARSAQLGLLSTGVAVIAGGAIATLSLRHAYGLAGLAAFLGLVATFQFRHYAGAAKPKTTMQRQFGEIWMVWQRPLVRVVFAFVIIMTILNHVPYEFAQPYLNLWVEQENFVWDVGIVAGVVTAIGLFIGAYFSRRLVLKLTSLPMALSMLLILAVTIFTIAVLGTSVGLLGVALLCLRTLPASLSRSVANIWISPLLANTVRATYLSVQSLVGRLSFSLVLVGLSRMATSETATQGDLSSMLLVTSTVALVFALVFLGFAFRYGKPGTGNNEPQ